MRAARALAPAALVAAVLIAGCGDEDDDDGSDRFADIPKRTIVAPTNLTAPRWERIGVFTGTAPTTETVAVSKRAIQWRVRWRCRSGRFEIAVTPRPRVGRPRLSSGCPGRGRAILATAGAQRLEIAASDRWRLIVEEELRTPLREPRLAAMRPSRLLSRGRFRPVEMTGGGTASLYRLTSGRLGLRMEGFRTEPNPDLVVWLSEARDPTTSKQIFGAPRAEIRRLKSTIGDQTYVLPKGSDPQRIKSVVVVNKPNRIAYAAAPLTR